MTIRRKTDSTATRPGPVRRPLSERFAECVLMPDKPGDCWLWTGGLKSGRGGKLRYGLIAAGGHAGGSMTAHRVSWELHRGPIPPGMKVLHKCDVPSCVNPEHLFLGTQRDNVYDCMAKGRRNVKRGSAKRGLAKLHEGQIPVIRLMLKGDMTCRAISAHFGVGRSTIAKVKSGESWDHVPTRNN